MSNTGDAAKTATVRGSAEFGTTASDRVLSIPAGSTRLIRVDQTASFTHTLAGEGFLLVDIEEGFTGTVAALNTDPTAVDR